MLNERQVEAVNHIDGSLLILAGAGSGKTTVIAERTAEMIKNRGISPYNILAITFTNKAAKELADRISKKSGSHVKEQLWARTFHSTCVRILRANAKRMDVIKPGFTIYDNTNSIDVVKQIVEEMGFDKKEVVPKNIYYAISMLKNEMVDYHTYMMQRPTNQYIDWNKASRVMNRVIREEDVSFFKEIYQKYQERLIQYNAVDFDDIILYVIDLFIKQPEVLQYYQERFRYILVDEYQDTNHAQYVFVKMLADKYKNIAVVGDPNQGIYSFRGSDRRNILNFKKDYPEAMVVKLEQNYRSTDVILEAANQVISRNSDDDGKRLFTTKTNGEKITNKTVIDEVEEANYVLTEIIQRMNNGAHYQDFAILSRTNGHTRSFEQVFIQAGIPYKIIGGQRFFDRKEVRDFVSYIKYIHNPYDVITFERIVNFPRRGIGPKTVDEVIERANKSNLVDVLENHQTLKLTRKSKAGLEEFINLQKYITEKMNNTPVDVLLRDIVYQSKLIQAFTESTEEEEKKRERIENISQLINMAADLVKKGEVETLEDFIEIISLYSDTDEVDDDNAVKIMTTHASKGLEFPIVFVVGLEEGTFPHDRSIAEGDIEEERRLMYVAMTRAMSKLYLINALSRLVFGQREIRKHSRFLEEFNFSLLD